MSQQLEAYLISSPSGTLLTQGPKYSYFPDSSKTYLLVKKNQDNSAKRIFSNIGVSITNTGSSILRSPVGSEEYIHQFVPEKVTEWGFSEIGSLT